MFFTYVKSDEVIGPYVDHVKCEQCSKANLHLRGKFSYLVVELFNLPLFMLKRRYEFSCDCGHCQIPNQKSQLFKQLKQQMLPWWYFATKYVGFLLVLLLTAWFYSQHLQAQQLRESLIASPQVNDFYFVDYHQINPDSNPIYRYTTLKVTAIEADKVSFVVGSVFLKHNYSVRNFVKADRPMIRGFFSKNHLTFSQQQLLNMYDKEVIFAIERPQNLSIAGSIVIPMAQPKMYSYQQNLDNQLGIALYRGEDGYDRDYVAAFAAFLKAAKAGDASGQYNLAEMY